MPTPAPHKQPHQTQWEKVKLGDMQNLQIKKGSLITKKQTKQGNIKVVAAGLNYSYLHNTSNRPKNTITISASGANAGFVNFWNEEIFASDCTTINADFEPTIRYIYYALKLIQNSILALARGTAQPHVYPNDIENIKIPLPPLPIQKNIAQILSTLDKKIELNTRINTELESMAKLLYTRYFVEFNFPDSSGKPYKASGGAMVYNPTLKREIPQDWEVIKLANRFNFERGEEFGTASYKESKVNKHHIKFYRVGDMIDDSKCVYVDSSKENAPLISENDLLVSFDGSVGRVAYGLNGTYSSGIRKITDKHGEICQSGLYFIFTDSHIQHTINQHATGTNIKHAGSAIENLYMPYSKEVFSDFQNKINSMFALMRHTKAQSQRLAEWRDYLLPLLMGDQVEVV